MDNILEAQRMVGDRAGLGFTNPSTASDGNKHNGKAHEVKINVFSLQKPICTTSSNDKKGQSTNGGNFKPVCHFCGVHGHIRPNCFQLHGYPYASLKNKYGNHRLNWSGINRKPHFRKPMQEYHMSVGHKKVERPAMLKTKSIWVRKSDLRKVILQ